MPSKDSSHILFYSSSIVLLNEPIFGWAVTYVLLSKMPYIALSRGLRFEPDGGHKET